MTKAFADATPDYSGLPISADVICLLIKLIAETDLLLLPVFDLILFYCKKPSS